MLKQADLFENFCSLTSAFIGSLSLSLFLKVLPGETVVVVAGTITATAGSLMIEPVTPAHYTTSHTNDVTTPPGTANGTVNGTVKISARISVLETVSYSGKHTRRSPLSRQRIMLTVCVWVVSERAGRACGKNRIVLVHLSWPESWSDMRLGRVAAFDLASESR